MAEFVVVDGEPPAAEDWALLEDEDDEGSAAGAPAVAVVPGPHFFPRGRVQEIGKYLANLQIRIIGCFEKNDFKLS